MPRIRSGSSPGCTAWPRTASRTETRSIEDATRQETARLHAGDPENRALWRRFIPHCLAALQAIYDRLGVRFDVQLGESFYDAQLGSIVADLEEKGIATLSEGAVVVFVEATEAPFIIRKSDGAYTYATTDLATIRHRVETWHPDQILYVVDHRQGDHFKQLFEVARKWGYRLGRSRACRLRHDSGCRSPSVQDARRRCRRPGIAAGRSDRPGANHRR